MCTYLRTRALRFGLPSARFSCGSDILRAEVCTVKRSRMQEHIARLCTEAGTEMSRTGCADLDNVRSRSRLRTGSVVCALRREDWLG